MECDVITCDNRKSKMYASPTNSLKFSGGKDANEDFYARREEEKITLCGMGEPEQRHGDRQLLLTLPHSKDISLTYLERSSTDLALEFPISQQNSAGSVHGGMSHRPGLGPISSAT